MNIEKYGTLGKTCLAVFIASITLYAVSTAMCNSILRGNSFLNLDRIVCIRIISIGNYDGNIFGSKLEVGLGKELNGVVSDNKASVCEVYCPFNLEESNAKAGQSGIFGLYTLEEYRDKHNYRVLALPESADYVCDSMDDCIIENLSLDGSKVNGLIYNKEAFRSLYEMENSKKSGGSLTLTLKDASECIDVLESKIRNIRDLGYVHGIAALVLLPIIVFMVLFVAAESFILERGMATWGDDTGNKDAEMTDNGGEYDFDELESKASKIKDTEAAGKVSNIIDTLKRAQQMNVNNALVNDYYRSTISSLIDSMIRLEGIGMGGENINESKQLALEALNYLEIGLNHAIDESYEGDNLNLKAEVKVLADMAKVGMDTNKLSLSLNEAGKESGKIRVNLA